MSTTLCLDLGTAHTGLAISHEGILAQPLATIFESNKEKLVGKLLPFIVKNHPEKIVIGTPNHGPLVKEAIDLKTKLEKSFPVRLSYFPKISLLVPPEVFSRKPAKLWSEEKRPNTKPPPPSFSKTTSTPSSPKPYSQCV
jgi:RNase H-fold protein (predicted Holliday junction resolvase)